MVFDYFLIGNYSLLHLYIKLLMQQSFIPLVPRALSPPQLYTLLKQIRLQSFDFYANTIINTIMLIIS